MFSSLKTKHIKWVMIFPHQKNEKSNHYQILVLVHTIGAVVTIGMIFFGAVVTIEMTCLYGYVTGTNYPCNCQTKSC